jgi:hypothetical protein
MNGGKPFIAPFVRAARFPDLETSIKVADKGLEVYNRLKSNYKISINGGACVGLAAISLGFANETIMNNILKVSGSTMKDFLKSMNTIRSLLNIPIEMSFQSIAEQAKIPVRYASTAQKIYNAMVARDPRDVGLQRPAVYAGVLLAIAVARGQKKEKVLERLSRVTYSDPFDVLGVEKLVREFEGGNYGIKEPSSQKSVSEEMVRTEVSEEVKAASEASKKSMEQDKKKKKKQTKLSFL